MRDDHPGAAGLLDGQRVLHDVAPPVGHGEVGGVPVLGVGCARRGGRGAADAVVARTLPAATGLAAVRRVDLAGALGGEPVGEQAPRARATYDGSPT